MVEVPAVFWNESYSKSKLETTATESPSADSLRCAAASLIAVIALNFRMLEGC